MASLRFGDGRDWFFERRFGMFIHWGLCAIPAWHEQIQWRRGIPRREYAKLLERFNPVRFDPDAWLDVALRNGMEYVCFTAKHHDGFCLWDTRLTDFNVMRSLYGRDVLALSAAGCPSASTTGASTGITRTTPTRGGITNSPRPRTGTCRIWTATWSSSGARFRNRQLRHDPRPVLGHERPRAPRPVDQRHGPSPATPGRHR